MCLTHLLASGRSLLFGDGCGRVSLQVSGTADTIGRYWWATMSFDPNTTTVIPPVGYPITDELPAVELRPRRPWWTMFALGAIVVGIGISGLYVANLVRDRRTANAEEAAVVVAPTPPPAIQPAPTPLPATAEPGYWQVVGVDEGLNVRSGPGTSNDVVGALLAGQRFVFATGERVSGGGGDWMQITLGDSEEVGWVSARFLAPDSAPPEGQPQATVAPVGAGESSTVCFSAQTDPNRVARIVFTDRIQISGEMVTGPVGAATRQQVTGTLDSGQAVITLVDASTGTATQQTWRFNPANVDIGDGTTMAVVACAAIGLG